MSIRYFATNRDNENLGRSCDSREERIKLQEGGYHFVDMKAYMSYYLSEVEVKSMPKEVIIKDSKETIFTEFLSNKKIGSIVICVHGYCVHFHDAQTWYGILTDALRHTSKLKGRVVTDPIDRDKKTLEDPDVTDGSLVAFIGFSWPSNGDVFSYMSDQGEARSSAPVLANLIAWIREERPGVSVNLICHSMGNYLACHMFKQLVNRESVPNGTISEELKIRINRNDIASEIKPEDKYFVDRYVMLAPDVERRHITKCVEVIEKIGTDEERATYVGPYYSGLEHLVGQVHNFYSRFDGALAISNIEKIPRKALVSAKGIMDKFTFGLIDYLERNPDEKWEQRLGATQQPIIAPPNMKSHNAVEITGREIGHSDYVDSTEIANVIAGILVSPLEA